MFTLSSIDFLVVSFSLTQYGNPHLSAIRRNTFRPLNTQPVPKNLLGEVMCPT